jgi:DNA-binding NarL/FixJ family response regulator
LIWWLWLIRRPSYSLGAHDLFSSGRDGGGLRTILDAEPDIDVVGQVRDGYEAVRLARQLRPDVVLMDVRMPGVRTVCQGDTLLAPSVSRRLIEAYVRRPRAGRPVPGAETLTPREVEVWRLVTAGRSNGEIGAELFLGEAAVKTHVSRLMAKLGARDRIQLVVLGFEGGLR